MRALLKVSRNSASPSPTYMLYSCAHDSGSRVAPEAVAAALARVVLLQPVRKMEKKIIEFGYPDHVEMKCHRARVGLTKQEGSSTAERERHISKWCHVHISLVVVSGGLPPAWNWTFEFSQTP